MAQSQNSVVDLTIPATSYHGLATYGNVMIGNKAFEFYNEKNPEDFIQIPWEQIDHVAGSVMFGRALCDHDQERWRLLVLYQGQQEDTARYARLYSRGPSGAVAELLRCGQARLLKLVQTVGKALVNAYCF